MGTKHFFFRGLKLLKRKEKENEKTSLISQTIYLKK